MEDIYCFAGNPLDRVSERRRDREWIASLLADPQSRILPLYDLKPSVPDLLHSALAWQEIAPWRPAIDSGAMLIFLGVDDDRRAFFAIDGTGIGEPDPTAENIDVRTLAPLIPSG